MKTHNYEYKTIPTNSITPDKTRKSYMMPQGIKEMAQSMKHFGVLVPIEVDSNNTIVLGEKRWLAAKEAGIKHIECRINDVHGYKRFYRQFVDNLSTNNYTSWEAGEALKRILRENKKFKNVHLSELLSNEAISYLKENVGVSREFIFEHLEEVLEDALADEQKIRKSIKNAKLKLNRIKKKNCR